MGTFFARGAGGAEFELDDLDPGTPRGENLAGQIHKGELVVLDKQGGNALAIEKVDEMLEPFGFRPNGVVVGDPIIEGPGPVLPIDPAVDLDRPQVGDAIPIEERIEPAADGPSGDPMLVPEPEPAEVDVASFVPTGRADDVIDWVRGAEKDHDPTDGWEDRARAALDVEQAKEKPGKGLLAKLEEIVAQADAPDDDTTTS